MSGENTESQSKPDSEIIVNTEPVAKKNVNWWFQRVFPAGLFLMVMIIAASIIPSVLNISCREKLFKDTLFDVVVVYVVFIGSFILFGFCMIFVMLFRYEPEVGSCSCFSFYRPKYRPYEISRLVWIPMPCHIFSFLFWIYSCVNATFFLRYNSTMIDENAITSCLMFQVSGVYSWIYMLAFGLYLFIGICTGGYSC